METRKGELIQGTKNGEPHVFKARPVTLPNGLKLNLFWYAPEDRYTNGKYKPTHSI